ncbi:MAG TPA: hypothetical protein VLH56_18285 [Dissulfurispiraceae bacterium]|nr:hypothetical protein [Dissulfurispiraceae bacterium]
MTKRTTGQLVALAYVLHGAAESFAKSEVGTYKLRRQAERVMKNCLNAIGSVGASVIVDRGDHREVSDALKRQAQRTLDDFVGVAGLHMARRDFYTPSFVTARVMGCHLAIDHLARKHKAGKPWARLEAVAATMLGMLISDMPEAEARMYRVAESFTERVVA